MRSRAFRTAGIHRPTLTSRSRSPGQSYDTGTFSITSLAGQAWAKAAAGGPPGNALVRTLAWLRSIFPALTCRNEMDSVDPARELVHTGRRGVRPIRSTMGRNSAWRRRLWCGPWPTERRLRYGRRDPSMRGKRRRRRMSGAPDLSKPMRRLCVGGRPASRNRLCRDHGRCEPIGDAQLQ